MTELTEIDFKKWVRKNWRGWISSYEPRKGGTVGVADLQIAVDQQLVPIELKVGTIVNNLTRESPLLRVDKIRPSQVQWHNSLWEKASVYSFFLVGVGNGVSDNGEPSRVFAFMGSAAKFYLKPVGLFMFQEIDPKHFHKELEKYISKLVS